VKKKVNMGVPFPQLLMVDGGLSSGNQEEGVEKAHPG
jgi:hypothetical protein